jgi:hypothetical protein
VTGDKVADLWNIVSGCLHWLAGDRARGRVTTQQSRRPWIYRRLCLRPDVQEVSKRQASRAGKEEHPSFHRAWSDRSGPTAKAYARRDRAQAAFSWRRELGQKRRRHQLNKRNCARRSKAGNSSRCDARPDRVFPSPRRVDGSANLLRLRRTARPRFEENRGHINLNKRTAQIIGTTAGASCYRHVEICIEKTTAPANGGRFVSAPIRSDSVRNVRYGLLRRVHPMSALPPKADIG